MASTSSMMEQACSINKTSTLSDMQHESRDLLDQHALQTNTSDVANLHTTSVAQSLETALKAGAPGHLRTVNQSATFLGMPREIRDMIYHYVFQNVYVYDVLIPAKYSEEMSKWEAANAPVKKVFGILDTADLRVRALVKQNFMINRQIRDEILPVFYKQYVFSVNDDDCGLCKTTAWLQRLQLEQLRLLQNVHVQVRLDGLNGPFLPLQWMEAEEELSQTRGGPLNVTLDFPSRHFRHYFILAYSKCSARRLAGATWDQIREQAGDIIDEIDDQVYADNDEESSDDSDYNYDMWNDYEDYDDGGRLSLDDDDNEWF